LFTRTQLLPFQLHTQKFLHGSGVVDVVLLPGPGVVLLVEDVVPPGGVVLLPGPGVVLLVEVVGTSTVPHGVSCGSPQITPGSPGGSQMHGRPSSPG
jgi:hypothetical protein